MITVFIEKQDAPELPMSLVFWPNSRFEISPKRLFMREIMAQYQEPFPEHQLYRAHSQRKLRDAAESAETPKEIENTMREYIPALLLFVSAHQRCRRNRRLRVSRITMEKRIYAPVRSPRARPIATLKNQRGIA